MAYGQDLEGAARRHYRAAEELKVINSPGAQRGCEAVAGYLYGLAGELALKALMKDSGMRPLAPQQRREDPFFAHFPELKHKLLDNLQGRRAGELKRIAESGIAFQAWDISMRYAPTNDIQAAWVNSWKLTAKTLLDQMEST